MPDFASPLALALLLAVPLVLYVRARGDTSGTHTRRTVANVLRVLGLAALVISVAGPLAKTVSSHTDVVFALDVSSSIDGATVAKALDMVNAALNAKPPDARVGLVVFGSDAAVEVLVRRAAKPVVEITADVQKGATDIARAIEVAVGAFPASGHRRVVVLSDGLENQGDARSAAAVARSIGVEINTVALERGPAHDEVYVQGIDAPSRVHVREPFEVRTTISSNETARAHLLVLRDGEVVRDDEVSLSPGANVFTLVDQAERAGLHEYEVIINSDEDGAQENNRYQAFVQVRGEPKVLHLVGEPELGRYVTAELKAQGFGVDELAALELPATVHALADYDLVVLNNVSGFDLSLEKMELLEGYVRDGGGGLVTLGGDRSYGAGGYLGTPVERALPVTMDIKTDVKIPSLAVVFVIDKSGSMATRSRGEEKLAIAKRAALASIELLSGLDRVGVLAFDDKLEWVVLPTEVGDRKAIAEKLRGLGAGGGTNLFDALEDAHRVMVEQEAKVKHLIVLSDGLSETAADFDGVARRLADDGITISTIALGSDADRALMERIAVLGRGRSYPTEDPQDIPRIFLSETMIVSRDLVVERETHPALVYNGEMLTGFAPEDFPPLGGYHRTYPKSAAQVLLGAPGEDPLLVTWRYGLGKSVAFMSDMTGRWGREWVAWPEFGRLIAQMARWTMRRTGTETLLPEFRWRGGRGEMLVDVLDRDERFINGLDMRAVVIDSERHSSRVALTQVAPGRYRGEFRITSAGRYYITLNGTGSLSDAVDPNGASADGQESAQDDQGDNPDAPGASIRVGPRTFGLAVPYSSEYLDLGIDRSLLGDLAQATGGRVLPLANTALAAMLAPSEKATAERFRIWWPFVVVALVLLVIEVAVRKLALPETWLKLFSFLRESRQSSLDEEPGYEALRASIAAVREAHIKALRDGGVYSHGDPAAQARLYLAGGGRRGR